MKCNLRKSKEDKSKLISLETREMADG